MGKRSMNTYLGAFSEFGPEDIEIIKTENARVTYFEGYLWDPPRTKRMQSGSRAVLLTKTAMKLP